MITCTAYREEGYTSYTWTDDTDGLSHTAVVAGWERALMESGGVDFESTFGPLAEQAIRDKRANQRFWAALGPVFEALR